MVARRPLLAPLCAVAVLALSTPLAAAIPPCVAVPVANDRCPEWTATEPGDRTEAVATTATDDRVFIAGSVEGDSYAMDVVALAAPTGQELWTRRVDGAVTALLYRHSLTVSPDGSQLLFMASTESRDFLVVALDPASGEVLWRTEYDGGGWDHARSLAVSPDSSEIYVTGTSEHRAGNLVLVALSAGDGGLEWTVRYRGPATGWGADAGYAVRVAPDGERVYVSGRSTGNSSWDLLALAYDVPDEDEEPSSTWAWARRFSPAQNVGLASRVGLGVSGDGSRVVIAGEGDNNFWTVAYAAGDGAKLWDAELHGTLLSEGWFSTLDESKVEIEGGRVFVATSKAWDPGPLLASYDLATGEELWTTRYLAGPPLETADMVLAPGGSTIYTLASTMDATYGTSVAAFDPGTGDQLWVGRLTSPVEDIFGNDLAISPSGDALVATGAIRAFDPQAQAYARDFLTWSYAT